MSATTSEKTKLMAIYRATAQHRWKQEQQELAHRREHGWKVAKVDIERCKPTLREAIIRGVPI